MNSEAPEETNKSTKTYNSLLLPVVCLLALVAGIYFSLKDIGGSTPPEVAGLFWPQQKSLEPFAMVSHENEEFTLDNLKGKWNLMFFGYTHCPDICPITMSILKQTAVNIKEKDEPSSEDLSVVFISVDGERDTPDHLNNYLEFFDPAFVGATGNTSQVDSLTKQLGIPYEIEKHEPGEDYLVSHSGAVLMISPEGKLAAIFQAPHAPQDLADSFIKVRSFLEQQSPS